MRFSHVFVTRPRQESEDLAAMLAPLDLQVVVQSAFDFRERDVACEQPEVLADLEGDNTPRLLIFTSPRAVKFGLAQLPFAGVGLHGHPARGGIFVNVDLHRRAACEVPPGELLVL